MDWKTLEEILNNSGYLKPMVMPTVSTLFGAVTFSIFYGGYKLGHKLYNKINKKFCSNSKDTRHYL